MARKNIIDTTPLLIVEHSLHPRNTFKKENGNVNASPASGDQINEFFNDMCNKVYKKKSEVGSLSVMTEGPSIHH